MTKKEMLIAFVRGYEARQAERVLSEALAEFEKTLRKRDRRWFKKPGKAK